MVTAAGTGVEPCEQEGKLSRMSTFEDQLVLAVRRLGAAAMIELFGSPENKHMVNQLLDHRLSGEDADRARSALDAVADRLSRGE